MTVINCLDVYFGFGRESTSLSISDLHEALKLFWVSQIVYKITITATKTSILFLYLRIFPHQKFRYATFAVMTFVVGYASASILVTIFQCQPISRVWDKSVAGHCINLTAFWYSNASSSIVSDLMIFALPIPLIHSLHLPTRQKVALVMVFAMATFPTIRRTAPFFQRPGPPWRQILE
ncbi:hypothetical protein MMC11_000008 [Xylographa trunciseda]|nr:hypothetical protein [Xylographa trunciseda]